MKGTRPVRARGALTAGRFASAPSRRLGKGSGGVITALLATALASLGPVAHNRGGSNMASGLVVALDDMRDAPRAALEVDEAYLGPILQTTRPRTITLINLNREFTRGVSYKREAQHWHESLPSADEHCTIVANADDPLVVWAMGSAPEMVWVAGGLFWRHDALLCRGCLEPCSSYRGGTKILGATRSQGQDVTNRTTERRQRT